LKLIQPIAMEKGLKFAIREGGRTVGAGQVTEIATIIITAMVWVMDFIAAGGLNFIYKLF
jgi:hypothetical protein